jgi:transcriptional regulator with XRE-family HTH domain
MGDEPNKQDRRDVERPHRLFGEEIKKARENLDLARPELGRRVDISYPMLANLESGRRRASDDIIERLAPALGLSARQLRDVRDALERNTSGWRLTDLRNEIAHGRLHMSPLVEPSDETGNQPSEVESMLEDMLVAAQRAETAALAAHPQRETASPRMRMTADIMRDLGSLHTTDLAKVRGYVDGLRAAREQAATAVSPTTDTPLIRVPDEPFGPLTPWLMPDWIKNVRRVDISRRVREYRLLRGFSKFAGQAGTLLAAGPNDDERPLPCDNHNEAAEAARIGERLARDFAKRAGGDAGMITASDWRSLERLRAYRLDDARKSTTLNWVVRMAVVATLLWPDDIDARLDFVKRCIPICKDQAPLIGDKKP